MADLDDRPKVITKLVQALSNQNFRCFCFAHRIKVGFLDEVQWKISDGLKAAVLVLTCITQTTP